MTDQQEFQRRVDEATQQIAGLLKRKNQAYGNAALEPVRVFSRLSPVERIKSRLDEKLSRLMSSGLSDNEEDTLDDLLGGLVLLKLALEDEREKVRRQEILDRGDSGGL